MGRATMGALGMCRHSFLSKGFLEVVLIFIAIFMNLARTSYAQPGFLSIDCGGTEGNYTDSLGLKWVTDNGTYIKSGISFSMPSFSSDVGNISSLASFRYFPEGRSKYCYKLSTTPNATYLIRASFYMSASVLNERKPFLFMVSINATNWFSLANGDDSNPDLNVREEGIFYSPEAEMHLCLVPVLGVPFISSVELRQLDPVMYQYSGSSLQYLALQFRYNIGAYDADPPVRYPDDEYDRIWPSPNTTDGTALPVISMSAPDQTTGPEVYYVPPEVMRNGWLLAYPTNQLTASLFGDNPQVFLAPGAYATFILYSEHLNASDGHVYSMNFTLDGREGPPWNFSNQASMVMVSNYILSSNHVGLTLDLAGGAKLEDGPTLNAVEIYTQYNFNFSTTSQDDDNAIKALMASFNLMDWQGDPCIPVPHDWLACSLNSPTFQPIRQPCLSDGSGLTQCVVQEGFLRSTYYVINVSLSNLPTSGFELLTASPSISLGSLSNMSITSSGVDGQTFDFFINQFSNVTKLTVLEFSNNSIDRIPNWNHVFNLVYLDLAHNNLTDLSTSTQDLPLPVTLQNLNLGYNAIASIPSAWQNTANNLVVLDLSHNKLQGEILMLDRMVQMNSRSLQELNVHDNNLYGTFNSTVYFAMPSNLTFANFSQNAIQGTLNLSIWYDTLKSAASGNVKATAAAQNQLFSFVNNNISDIIPNVKAFDSTVETVLEGQQYGGILLGGNPYCNGASTYIQHYLCRFALNETIERRNKENKTVLIVGICGGIVALLLVCGVFATLWHLWKQVFSLRAVQQALADRKVQPPFYHYSDLKSATRDFHREAKLGHGSFGVVYKGVLVDGTILAVKKLFDSQGQQVLDEFLNEVVLITGIKHRNLVQLKGCCIKDKQRMLVFEYAEKGNLAEALERGSKVHGGLDWEQRFDICVGVARGLAYLHEELQPSIIHRDIKPANILLDKNFNPKIADFGLARQHSDETNQSQYTQIAGTLGYFAPEYAMEGQLSNKADVYSYGILVLEIVSGHKVIDSSLPQEQKFLKNWAYDLIRKGLALDILDPELRDCYVPAEVIRVIKIALLCVQHYPERRPSMSQVVTLLSGNTNVEGFPLGESKSIQSDSEDLLVTINRDIDYPALHRLVGEDSTSYPTLSVDSQPSSSNYTAGSTSRSLDPSIELSSVRGR